MKRIVMTIVAMAFAGVGLGAALAQDEGPIKQRQNLMEENGDAAKLASQMLKGEREYDAAKAAEAMKAISASTDEFITLFPEGSQEGSDAKPIIWEEKENFDSLAMKLKEVSAKAADAASGGLESFQPAFLEVGQACKDCHEKYRVEQD